MNWLVNALASGFYLSYIPAALFKNRATTGAGLVGTLWGAAALRGLPQAPVRQALVWLGVLAISVAVGDAAQDALGHDDPRIVIDEFVGYWTAVLFLPRSAAVLVLAFVLFRVFDVWKPGIIRRAQALPGGWGVVLDDVLAGAAANVLLRLVSVFHPL